MKDYGAQSETTPLKRVLMHRPGDEFDLVTPETLAEFNFREPVNRETFYAAFDTITGHLEAEGAEVILLTDVFAGDTEALRYISRRPNVTYTRDLATVFDAGSIIHSPTLTGRRGDEKIIKKALQKLGVPILGEIPYDERLEGGAVTFLTPEICAASLCDRATEGAFYYLAELLLGKHLDKLVMVPTAKGIVHIDGQFLVAGEKLAFIYAEDINLHPSTVFTRQAGRIRTRHVWFLDLMAELDFELIELTREERDMGALNFIQTAPKRAIGFDRAKRLGGELEARGGRALYFDGTEIIKGNAGAHCMTCPVLRSD